MAQRRDPGAETGFHPNGHLRQKGFAQQDIGKDTNIGANAHKGDGCHGGLLVALLQTFRQLA